MSSDPSIIEQYANRLQQKAGSRVTRLTGLGFALGTALGAGPLVLEHVSTAHQAIPHRFAYAIILIGAAAGGYLGYILGQSRAVTLRLQASLALNQLEIERVVRRVEGIRLTLPAPPAPLPAAAPTAALPAPPAPLAPPAPPALAPAMSLPAAPPTVLTATPAPTLAPAAEAPTIPAMPAPVPPSMPAPMAPPLAAPAPMPVPEPIQVIAAAPEPAPVAPAPQPVPTVQIVPPPTFEWNAPPSSASGS